tara:strand:+ start:489 stop:1385 length:897 start_codon:yes stop_codon:yes gene_type:complete
MVVIETKLEGFNNKLSFDKLNYPNCICGKCPRFFWNMLNIGARGSGKTYTIVQMIKHYEKNKIMKDGVVYKLRTHLISPTIQANEIYQSLDSLDMDKDAHENYSDKLILDIIADIKERKQKYEDYLLYKKYYEKVMKIPENKIEKAYDDNPDMFNLLERFNYQHPSEIEHEKPEVNIIILDDLLGSDAFTRKTKSTLVNAMIKNRHIGVCFALLVQSIRSVPKNIRLNCSVFQLATFKNKRMVLDDIYEEISNVLSIDDFEELYDHATAKPYGSLIIDTTNGKRFLSNLDFELSLKSS